MYDAEINDRKSLAADHLDAIDKHLADGDAKHAPVIRTILEALRNLLAPVSEPLAGRDSEPQEPGNV